MDNNVIELAFEKKTNEMVCPFRTEIIGGQRLNENMEPEQFQRTLFPPCQYNLCPFYNNEATDNSMRCNRVDVANF